MSFFSAKSTISFAGFPSRITGSTSTFAALPAFST
jgi:hypothetical protein